MNPVRRYFERFGLVANIVLLSFVLIVAVVATIWLGWIIGLLVFLLSGGGESAWALITYRSRKQMHEEEDLRRAEKFSDDTKNNPTIR